MRALRQRDRGEVKTGCKLCIPELIVFTGNVMCVTKGEFGLPGAHAGQLSPRRDDVRARSDRHLGFLGLSKISADSYAASPSTKAPVAIAAVLSTNSRYFALLGDAADEMAGRRR